MLRGCCTCCPEAPTSAPRWSRTADRGDRVTGSTRAGRSIAVAAAQHLKRVHLELGGNSALVVFDDVDLERAASVGSFGSFHHAGQVCMASSRHLVHASIADDYAAVLAERASALPVGDPAGDDVAVGPVIDVGQRDTVHGIVPDALDAGAKLRAGGTFEGLFYRPTVLSDVPHPRARTPRRSSVRSRPWCHSPILTRRRDWRPARHTVSRWASSPGT